MLAWDNIMPKMWDRGIYLHFEFFKNIRVKLLFIFEIFYRQMLSCYTKKKDARRAISYIDLKHFENIANET